MEDFEQQTVFVSGGARGVGYGLAHAFASAGARVVVTDIDEAALDSAVTRLSGMTDVAGHLLDVRDRSRFAEVADAVDRDFGGVTILCNNAGVSGAFALGELSFDIWDATVGINLGGAINGLQTFLPRMLQSGRPGHIVNTSSAAGLVAGGERTGAPYDTTKFALVGLSESLSRHAELVRAGIGVSVLCAGPVATNGLSNTRSVLGPAAAGNAERDRWWTEKEALLNVIGQAPEAVGRMVVEGVRAGRLYIHTDRSMAEALAVRAQVLLDSLPEPTDHDRRMADLVSPPRG